MIDFFQWIEEAYYKLKKDFPNINNCSCLAVTVIENTYQTYITAKGKPIQTIHPPCTLLVMKIEYKVIDAIPSKYGIANDGINHVIYQNKYPNMSPLEEGESSSKEDSVLFKPPPSFEKENFHLNSKKDSEFVEELIKIKVEEQKAKVTITTLKKETSEEDEAPKEEVELDELSFKGNKTPKQYSKPYFLRSTPVDLQFEEKAKFGLFNGESIVEWNRDENAKDKILKALCTDPITHEQKADVVNTLIYTIMAHFMGANKLHSDRTTEQLINLRCRTLSYFYC
ncbi:hypothetical protein CDL12_01871 [Handroanthus impetiginosus]|uniref:Uncharacterized protein n=1 Tax=Handroanthus impetiginosus TaxID=429701 RepID=A0A2G9I6L2_9LAMI|nr:hypothetical protein CDL12_01871 [Handroanthus impetiginosus]